MSFIVDPRDLLRIRGILLHTLAEQQEYRSLRNEDIDGELGWIIAERLAMFAEVNRLLSTRGLPTIQLSELCRAELRAVGHSDYSEKFALYCAELVLS